MKAKDPITGEMKRFGCEGRRYITFTFSNRL